MQPKFRTLAAGALLLTLAGQGLAQAAIQVTLDDHTLATSAAPIQVNGRTLVPMRDIFEALGASLQWNALNQTVTATKDLTTIQLAIDNPNAIVNGRSVQLDQPAELVGGRTFVPLRFISEAMNAQVAWDNANQIVSIHTAGAAAQAPQIEPSFDEAPAPPVVAAPAPVYQQPVPAYQPPAPVYQVPAPAYQPPAPVLQTGDGGYANPAPADGNYPPPPPPPAVNPANDPNSPYYQPPAYNVPAPPPAYPGNAYDPSTDPNSPLYIAPAPPEYPIDQPGGQPQPLPIGNAIALPAGTVIPVQFDRDVSSATAQVGQSVTATVVSRQQGDSEFPAGTRLGAVVIEAQPSQNGQPGVLDLDFQNALLPDGRHVALRGQLIALDGTNVQTQNGHVVARADHRSQRSQIIGIGAGAGAGFVLGKLLKTNSAVTTILGAAGGYLVGQNQARQSQEATVRRGTVIGVQLLDPIQYADVSGYGQFRGGYLQNNSANTFDPNYYGAVGTIAGPRPGDANAPAYDGYTVSNTAPNYGPAGIYAPNPVNNPGAAAFAPVAMTVPPGSVVPVTMDTRLSSATAVAGQAFSTTVVSQNPGDSEFPRGTRLVGVVQNVQPRNGNDPGVLDLSFTEADLPDGTRVSLDGHLISLDKNSVNVEHGRLVAKDKSVNKATIIGGGAAAGFVIGRLVHKNGILPTLLGALGGALVASGQNARPQDAVVPAGTKIGVRIDSGGTYTDTTGYANYRSRYLGS